MKRSSIGFAIIIALGLFSTIYMLLPQIQLAFNSPPQIDSFNPTNMNLEMIEGDSISFQISANDADNDQLSYTWKLSNSIVLSDEGTSSSYTYHSKQGDGGQQIIQCMVSDGNEGIASVEWEVIVHYVRLSININVEEEGWIRDTISDLPTHQHTVSFSIINSGDITAENVQINILLNEQSIDTELYTIPANNEYSSNFPLHLQYDTINTITIKASNAHISQSKDTIMSANLNRWPVSSNIRQLYVTPNDESITSKVEEILDERPWWDIRPDWQLIYDWVNNYIEYENDSIQFSKLEYWQLPQETITNGKGDCEDQAILLCTLLRAHGYSSDDVFIILGSPDGPGSGHAWVTFKVFNILDELEYWHYLEATTSGWIIEIEDFLDQILGTYEDLYGTNRVYFNDLQYWTN